MEGEPDRRAGTVLKTVGTPKKVCGSRPAALRHSWSNNMYDPNNDFGGVNPLIATGLVLLVFGLFIPGMPGWAVVACIVAVLVGGAWEIFKKLTIGMIYYNAAWRWDRRDK